MREKKRRRQLLNQTNYRDTCCLNQYGGLPSIVQLRRRGCWKERGQQINAMLMLLKDLESRLHYQILNLNLSSLMNTSRLKQALTRKNQKPQPSTSSTLVIEPNVSFLLIASCLQQSKSSLCTIVIMPSNFSCIFHLHSSRDPRIQSVSGRSMRELRPQIIPVSRLHQTMKSSYLSL